MNAERRGSGAFWVLLIVVVSVGATGLLGWWLPKVRRDRMARNERNASACLKMLSIANVDFKANDRDRNALHDYWTGDVAGLYRFDQLIERSFAEADARSLAPLTSPAIPTWGYFLVALEMDDSLPSLTYRTDTDGRSGKVHHPTKFAFCAYPADYGVTGRSTYLINELQDVFKGDTEGRPILSWPTDAEMLRTWCTP